MSYKKIHMSFNIKRHIHARVIFRCPYSGIRPTPGQGPAWTGSRFKDSGPAWRDWRCDYAVTPQKEMLPHVHRLADSRPLGDWICDEFCIWDTEGIEPTRDKPWSHTVYDLNHSVNRVYTIGTECSHHMAYTIGTECSHHMWWEHSVPIVWWEHSVPIVQWRLTE